MNKAEKKFIYDANMRFMPFIFALLTTPLSYFSTIYAYFVTDSFLIAGMVLSFGEIVKSAMEVPTGVVSDRYLGRKGTHMMADLFLIVGSVIQILAMHVWWLLFVGEFFMGVALALYSGNASSFLHDTLKLVDKENDYHKTFAKMHHYRYFLMSISVLLVGFLTYYFGVVMVLYYCAFQKILSLAIWIFVKEPNIYNIEEDKSIRSGFLHILASSKKIYKNQKLFKLATLCVYRKSLDALDQLGMVFYKTVMSLLSIGLLLSASLFVCNFTSLYSEKIAKRFGFLRTFIGVRFVAVPLQVIGYFFGNFYSPILVEAGAVLNPIETSAQSALLHKEFSNKQRATMESVVEFIGSIGYSLFAIFFGWLAEVWSLQAALLIGTSLKFFVIPICYKTFAKSAAS